MSARIKIEKGERITGTRLCYVADVARVDPKRRRAKFLCDCGSVIEADLNWVRFKNITSCGCYKSEVLAEKNKRHGHAVRGKQSGAYRSFQAMHQRVIANPNYAGVSICDRWCGEKGFENFYADMGDRPVGYSIERIDNNGNYEPSNCKWATKHEQAQNMSQTAQVTICGETHSISEWCRIKGIAYYLVKQRRKRGMSVEEAIITPINTSKQGRKRHV